jgi:hypothetical protein
VTVSQCNQRCILWWLGSRGIGVVLTVFGAALKYVRSDAKRPFPVQPSEALKVAVCTDSSTAPHIDPKSPSLDDLKIDVSRTYLPVIKDDISTRTAANYRKWLSQQPYFSLLCDLTFDGELERIRNTTSA